MWAPTVDYRCTRFLPIRSVRQGMATTVAESDNQICLELLARKIAMTYWERLRCSQWKIRNNPNCRIRPVSPTHINKIEVWYCGPYIPPHTISGSNDSCRFLSTYSSFMEVQESLKLAGPIDHITCMQYTDDLCHLIDTIEKFWKDGSSLLEKDITERAGDK